MIATGGGRNKSQFKGVSFTAGILGQQLEQDHVYSGNRTKARAPEFRSVLGLIPIVDSRRRRMVGLQLVPTNVCDGDRASDSRFGAHWRRSDRAAVSRGCYQGPFPNAC